MSAGPASVGALMALARALGVARLDAQWLLAHHLEQPRSWLLAHDDAEVAAPLAEHIQADLRRRADNVPLAYLTGWREFHGLHLQVGPAVLDPRPDTEILVDWALDLLAGELAERARPEVLDLGTGSGAIALAVRQACTRARVRAVERSAPALELARANGERLGLPVQWLAGDWWAAVQPPDLDLVLSNPPYVRAGDPHLPALRHEPVQALVAGEDGLADITTIIRGAPRHLRPGAWLLVEHGFDQGEAVRALLAAAGFVSVTTRRDLAGHERCSGARRASEAPAARG